jgi:hypothetical protein
VGLLGDEAQVEARFGPFGEVLILTQDRCTVCTERTIGSQIVWDEPDGHVSDMGRVESRFSPFGDSVSVSARQVHGLHRTYNRH